jgi:hypothetical protein
VKTVDDLNSMVYARGARLFPTVGRFFNARSPLGANFMEASAQTRQCNGMVVAEITANIVVRDRPWRRGIVVIASAYRTEDPGFESCQGVRFFRIFYIAVLLSLSLSLCHCCHCHCVYLRRNKLFFFK